jgi:hypothetical protein
VNAAIQPSTFFCSEHSMLVRGSQLAMLLATFIVVAGGQRSALAYIAAARWTSTALGNVGFRGDPMTLTWSLVPDATPIPDRQASSLVALMDAEFGVGSGGANLTARPWFPLVNAAFARWSELGGLNFAYEPNDDGSPVLASGGVQGVRGDVRLAGTLADGPGGVFASSHYPNTGDIILDVEESFRFGNPDQNYIRLRNVLMHEIGHALGLEHIVSSDAKFLMETSLDVSFDGPQIDEVRGLHYLYGDHLERSAQGSRNDSPATAVPLGVLQPGESFALGIDAGDNSMVASSQVDFLSISNRDDIDYFRFETAGPALLSVQLTPRGGTSRQSEVGGSEILVDARASSDLSLMLLDASGMPLISANDNSRGEGEEIVSFSLATSGGYLLRVSGSREAVQLYELHGVLGGVHAPEPTGMELGLMLLAALSGRRQARRRTNAHPRASSFTERW